MKKKRKKVRKNKNILLLTFNIRIVLINMLNKSLSDSSPYLYILSILVLFVLNYLQKVKK